MGRTGRVPRSTSGAPMLQSARRIAPQSNMSSDGQELKEGEHGAPLRVISAPH